MFDFYLVGSGTERDDFPYILSHCGKWLFEKGKSRIIDLVKEVEFCKVDDTEGLCDLSEIAGNEFKFLKSTEEGLLRQNFS